jgi:hypothetical protein
MKKKFFITILHIFIFASCQKELAEFHDDGNNGGRDGDNPTNTIEGTWNFVSMESKTQNILETKLLSSTKKTVSFLDYITSKNSGTLSFNDSVIKATALTFTASYTMKSYKYKNGMLSDSLKIPVNFTLPSMNASSKYELIGADSIHFPHTTIFYVPNSGIQSLPPGVKFTLTDSTLTLIGHVNTDTTKIISGIQSRFIETGIVTVTLKKN